MRTSCRTVLFALAAAVVFCGAVLPASAGTLTVVAPAPANQQFQQTLNSPCVFGDASCKQPTISSTLLTFGDISSGGSLQNFGVPTPVMQSYTVSQLAAALGCTNNGSNVTGDCGYIIGVDINQAGNHPPDLTYFQACIGGACDTFGTSGSSTFNSLGVLLFVNNGNGFADDVITGFTATNLSGKSLTATITFKLTYLSASDGTEEFFIIRTAAPPPVVPEPATMLLMGSGLLGIAGILRRRFKA